MKKRSANKASARGAIRVILIALLLPLTVALIFELTRHQRPPNPVDSFIDELIGRDYVYDDETDEPFDVAFVLPSSGITLSVGDERAAFDGGLTLIVPRMGINREVGPDTARETLKQGPGLFDYAELPGEGDSNTSIAGHSDAVFFYLDQLKNGDLVYLIYEDRVFTYEHAETTIVTPTDWSVIAPQGKPCVTLVTCTPKGKATHRLVARAELVSVSELTEYSDFTQISRSASGAEDDGRIGR